MIEDFPNPFFISILTLPEFLQLGEQLPTMIQGVMSDNLDLQLDCTTKFRKLLSKERSPPIDKVISCGVVPRFVEFLRSPHSPLQVSYSRAKSRISQDR